MLYYMGGSQHTQNEVIGGNKKMWFYLMEKINWTFWPTQYLKKIPLSNWQTIEKARFCPAYIVSSLFMFSVTSAFFIS